MLMSDLVAGTLCAHKDYENYFLVILGRDTEQVEDCIYCFFYCLETWRGKNGPDIEARRVFAPYILRKFDLVATPQEESE